MHIGGQRCGTTWMYSCLSEHPEIFMPEPKEIHYFDNNLDKGDEWYVQHFQPTESHTAWGEATPRYLHWGDDSVSVPWGQDGEPVPPRLAQLAPDCRLICCLRNPIERAYSQWRWMNYNMEDNINFEEMVAENMYDCLTMGRYADHIKRYFDFFPKNQILIQIYKDVVNNNQGAVQEAYDHLGVDSTYVPEEIGNAYNSVIFPKVQKVIDNYGLECIVKAVKSTAIGDWIRRRAQSQNRQNKYRKKISPETRKYLNDYFSEQIEEAEKLIDDDLSHWKSY